MPTLYFSPLLTWGYDGYCPEGSTSDSLWLHVCPERYTCPNVTTKVLCTAGQACPHGTNGSIACSSDWFGTVSAAERCPAGSKAEPRREEIIVWLLMIVLPCITIIETASIRDILRRKRRPVLILGKWVKAVKKHEEHVRKFDARSRAPFAEHSLAEASISVEEAADVGMPSRCSTVQGEQSVATESSVAYGSASKGRTFIRLELNSVNFHIGKAHVLRGLRAQMQQGQLIGLMGESGSGKTTLLNVIGGRASYGWTSGEMLLNRRPFRPANIRHLLGYVPQAHLVFKELTVYENLAYAAKLRLNRQTPAARRMQLVETALELLRLNDCRHFVCDPSIGERLSGGQLRRIGIGVELVCDPPILLLDEPTSALDAVNTRLVVAALKDLAERGVLVVASLHQPRHAVYHMLDKLMLLRKGEMVYGGMRADAVGYFEQLGYTLPQQANPADFFIEIAFGHEHSNKRLIDLIGSSFGEQLTRASSSDHLKVKLNEEQINQLVAARLISNALGDKLKRKAQEGAWHRDGQGPAMVSEDHLGRLWKQYYIRANRTVTMLMGIIKKRQTFTPDQRRAQAILQFALTQSRGEQLNRYGIGSGKAPASDSRHRGERRVSSPQRSRSRVSSTRVSQDHSLDVISSHLEASSATEGVIGGVIRQCARVVSSRGRNSSTQSGRVGHEPRARLLRRWSITNSKNDQQRLAYVTPKECEAWFDENYGTMIRKEVAAEIWRRAAKRAQNAVTHAMRDRRYHWTIDEDMTLRPNTSDAAHAETDGFQVLPSRVGLQHEVHAWELPNNEKQPLYLHFRVCARRYFKKLLRKRMSLYQLLVVVGLLGYLCGVLHGADPDHTDMVTYFMLFNTIFATVVATSTIRTFDAGGAEGGFFQHEADSGVSQLAEGIARLLIDMVPLSLLPFVFSLPLKAMITGPLWFCDTWLALAWAIAPLGYLCTLLVPGNATVLASSITFVLCAFMNGFFGLTLSSLNKGSTLWTLLNASPGKASFHLLFWGNAVASPFGSARAWSTLQLQQNGLLPSFDCASQNYTCKGLEQAAILREELGLSGWRQRAYFDLILFGLICRMLALVLFCGRSKIKLAGTWRHLRHGPAGRFRQVIARLCLPTRHHRRHDVTVEQEAALLHRTTSFQIPGVGSHLMITRQTSSGKFERLSTTPTPPGAGCRSSTAFEARISGPASSGKARTSSVAFNLNPPPPPPPALPLPPPPRRPPHQMHDRFRPSITVHSVAPAGVSYASPRASLEQPESRKTLVELGSRPASSRGSTGRQSTCYEGSGRAVDRASHLVSNNI